MAVSDELRDEEIFACVVATDEAMVNRNLALELHRFDAGHLAYYKPPGCVYFVDQLLITGMQRLTLKTFPPLETT